MQHRTSQNHRDADRGRTTTIGVAGPPVAECAGRRAARPDHSGVRRGSCNDGRRPAPACLGDDGVQVALAIS